MQAAGGAHAVEGAREPAAPRRSRDPAILFATAAIAIGLDQLTKAIALATLDFFRTVPVIDGVFHWTLKRNPGAAFGLFSGAPMLVGIIATGIALFIALTAHRVRGRLNAVALGLVLGGAVGNIIDRVLREPGGLRGAVIDFIDLRVWPVFNVADVCVVVGAGLLVLASIRRPTARDA